MSNRNLGIGLVALGLANASCTFVAKFDGREADQGGAGGKREVTGVAGVGRGGGTQSGSGGRTSGGNTVVAGTSASTGGNLPTTGGGAGAGVPANGGTVSGGSAGESAVGRTGIGGALLATGGVAAGGIAGNGGASTGGTLSTGGKAATGGSGIGGASTGGTVTTGGTVSTGGAVTTGGTVSTGGSPSTGGAASTGKPFVPNANSCSGLASTCLGESCCTSIAMTGGIYAMGRSEVSGASDYYATGEASEVPEHSATVNAFALDKYEVTVGRFRKFVGAYDTWHVTGGTLGASPSAFGQNPAASGTGWGQSWTASAADLPSSSTGLIASVKCNTDNQTWTDSPGTSATESYPINCLTWYVAFAFCVWDGGRLPSEAEWEYAAAGGSENRFYPWGSLGASTRANFLGSDMSPFIIVGSRAASGVGYFGQLDLAGSVEEWVFDWYSVAAYAGGTALNPCYNCANTANAENTRVIKGGGWMSDSAGLRAVRRNALAPNSLVATFGVRCARPSQ